MSGVIPFRTVVLQLLRYVYSKKKISEPIRAIYFTGDDMFDEEKAFVDECVGRYSLRMAKFPHPYKEGLTQFMSREGQDIRHGFVLGQRQSDPSAAALEPFTQSSPGWPDFVRVNPLLRWTYGDVWALLLKIEAPYCSLYDQGYTSIGRVSQTARNAILKTPTGYRPAYELEDADMEREGRQ